MNRLFEYLRERGAIREIQPEMVKGGASVAYVFGTVLVFLLTLEALTGLALAAFYSPSSTDAWGSVAYIQDQATWGWLVRGLHHHAPGAIVIVSGVHLVQTAIAGAYKKPRELVWWLGILLLLLLLAWAVTGYVLPWDQAGYWANRVEVGIAAGTPGLGDPIKQLSLGGNDYGNLTLTRFYMLHVVLMPVAVTGVLIGHIVIARRHGLTPMRPKSKTPAVPRMPNQRVLDVSAMAIVLAVLLSFVVTQGGTGLAAPADPSMAYDARPLWYFRWLFELRELAGSGEQIVAMVAPALVGGYLVAMPLVDSRWERTVQHRRLWLGILAGVLAVLAALTVKSFSRDAGDAEYVKRRAEADRLAERARAIARDYGVPVTGGAEIWSNAPQGRGRMLFAKMCAGCHDASDEDRKKDRIGPIIGPGHGNREWLMSFLKEPSAERFWGRTKLVLEDDRRETKLAMKPITTFEIKPDQVDDLVEFLVSQSGEPVDAARAARGQKVFEKCTDCHSVEEGVAEPAGPNLFGLHSREFYISFIANPKLPVHMGKDKSEMPRFDTDLTYADRDAIAEYLVWLRTATKADLDKLGPL